ncbi:MAG: DNA mismatch repair protein MutT, partial [Acinetobacter bohemicus]
YVYVVTLDHAPQIDAEIAEMKWVDLDDQTTLLAPLTTEIVMPWVKNYLKVEVE